MTKTIGEKKSFNWFYIGVLIVFSLLIVSVVAINNSHNSKSDSMSIEVEDGTISLVPTNKSDDMKQVDYFEDLMCPHCEELSSTSHNQMVNAIREGKIQVNYHLLTFLDDKIGSPVSSRAAESLILLAESEDVDSFLEYHQNILKSQATIRSEDWDSKKFAHLADSSNAGPEVIKAIDRLGNENNYAKKFNSKSESVLASYGEGISSPQVFVDGTKLDLRRNNLGAYYPWVQDAIDNK